MCNLTVKPPWDMHSRNIWILIIEIWLGIAKKGKPPSDLWQENGHTVTYSYIAVKINELGLHAARWKPPTNRMGAKKETSEVYK